MSDNINDQNRRVFLKRLSQAVGMASATALASGAGLNVAYAYQIRPNSAQTAGRIFSQTQMLTLMHIANTILPKTDTPSGADVDCHGFVDHQLAQCFEQHTQQEMKAIVDDINRHCQQNFSKGFADVTPQAQISVLQKIESQQGFNDTQKGQFKTLKSLIVFGFFTSEVGASQALRYDPVPGGFRVISYKPGDKAWGSLAYY